MVAGRDGDDGDLDAYGAALRAGRVDPGGGLPDPVFQFALDIVPMINVDLLLRDAAGRVLLAWRDDAFGRGWHVPGGIIRRGESFADRIAAVARLELGTTVAHEAEPCRVSQLPNDGRGHFISLLFRCALAAPLDPAALAGAVPRAGDLSWCAGAPAALYPAHEIYRALLAG